MRLQHYNIFDFVRCLIFCTFLTQFPKKAFGFWPFTDTTPTTPTLKFYPEPPDANQNTLIYYKHSDIESSRKHVDSLKTFLSTYTYDVIQASNVYNCRFEPPPPPNKVCDVNVRLLDVCSGQDFGFNRGGPCILLTMTKVENWIPTTFNESALPANMPFYLRKFISEQQEKDYIWVSCEGDNPADVEFIGPIEYYPTPGFPAYYFPFKNQENYLSPIVAVRFIRPTKGVVISIGCKLWATNIQIDQEKQIGYTNFHLLID